MKRQLQMIAMAVLALAGSQAHALCTFGSSNEPSLQGAFDSLLGSGTLNAAPVCVDDDNRSTGALGFYLSTQPNSTLFSQSSRNADGVDHLYAHQGAGAPVPLPAPVVMVMSGLIGLVGVSRRTA